MNSPISRTGGKKLLRKDILKRFPIDHPDKYVEVFGGAGWVLFAAERHAPVEVFNDIDGDLVNLFRCMKYHCAELQKELQWLLSSRELFDDAREQLACRGFTDIQRAARYYLLVKEGYGASARYYGGNIVHYSKVVEYLTLVQLRLENVRIEHKDFRSLIHQFDHKQTLFYLDPPYFGAEDYYAHKFTFDDHVCLNEILKSISGKFILSYNDHHQVREWYKDFRIEEISRSNNLTGHYADRKNATYKELIIRNF